MDVDDVVSQGPYILMLMPLHYALWINGGDVQGRCGVPAPAVWNSFLRCSTNGGHIYHKKLDWRHNIGENTP
jgi:hypothetical protein